MSPIFEASRCSPFTLVAVASWTTLLAAFGCSSGEEPPDMAAASGARIYVTVSGDDEIVVLDEQSRTISSHIAVGKGPAILLATPDRTKLYTAKWAGDSVSAVDTASEAVTNIALAGRPYVIAMAPAGDFVYAGLNPTGIGVIDTVSDELVRTIPTSELAASLIVSPDGETLYIASLGLNAGSLRAISPSNGEEVHPPIAVGAAPAWITIQPDGSRVYTLNFLSDDISVVDTALWQVVATVDTGTGSQAITGHVTPDGSRLYVTNHGTSELMAIDTASNSVTQTIKLDGRPVGVNFNADGTRVYVTDFGPQSLDAPPDINYLLTGSLTATGPGQISVYGVASDELLGKRVSLGPGPTSVIVDDL